MLGGVVWNLANILLCKGNRDSAERGDSGNSKMKFVFQGKKLPFVKGSNSQTARYRLTRLNWIPGSFFVVAQFVFFVDFMLLSHDDLGVLSGKRYQFLNFTSGSFHEVSAWWEMPLVFLSALDWVWSLVPLSPMCRTAGDSCTEWKKNMLDCWTWWHMATIHLKNHNLRHFWSHLFKHQSVAFLNSNNLDRIQRANWLSLFQASWNQFTCEFDENFLSWISTYNLSTPQKIVHLKFPWGQSNDMGQSSLIWHRASVRALFARCHCGADGHLYRWLPFLSQGKRGLKQKLNWLSCFEVLFSLQFSNKYKCVTFIISALLCNQNLFENKNFIQTTFHPSQKTSNDIKNNKTDNIIFNTTLFLQVFHNVMLISNHHSPPSSWWFRVKLPSATQVEFRRQGSGTSGSDESSEAEAKSIQWVLGNVENKYIYCYILYIV